MNLCEDVIEVVTKMLGISKDQIPTDLQNAVLRTQELLSDFYQVPNHGLTPQIIATIIALHEWQNHES